LEGEGEMNNFQNPIALGRTAEIFPFEEGKVLKLFYPAIPLSWIDREVDIGRYIQDLQLPVPKVYERMKLNGREGVVYERIDGPSLLNELATKPWKLVHFGHLLANLHVKVHDVPAPANLETQRDWAKGGIPETNKFSKDLQQRILHLLDSMPTGTQLCHGDFHPGNIIVTHRGPVIIDWMTATKGGASGDMARSTVILEAAKAPEGTPMRWLLEWVRKMFLQTYIKTYFQLRPAEKSLFIAWRTIMAANFLVDVSLPEEEATLMEIITQGIESLDGS
jgi:aminoglycoside phosphotransferase (APT) family kinase protein